jgi:hypothetical protein
VLLPRDAVDRNRFSLAMSSHGMCPLSDNLTPSTALVPVRNFTCTHVLYLVPAIANDTYPVSWSASAIDRFWPGSGQVRCIQLATETLPKSSR